MQQYVMLNVHQINIKQFMKHIQIMKLSVDIAMIIVMNVMADCNHKWSINSIITSTCLRLCNHPSLSICLQQNYAKTIMQKFYSNFHTVTAYAWLDIEGDVIDVCMPVCLCW